MGRWMFLVLPSLFALLHAQAVSAETITVGPSGSGAQFTDFQDAVDAAQPHDTILVLAGEDYEGPFWVGTPVQIVGIGDPYFHASGFGATTMIIQDATAIFEPGDFVLLAGVSLWGGSDPYWGASNGLSTDVPTVLVDCEVVRMSVVGGPLIMDGCTVSELQAFGAELWINASQISGWHELYGGPVVPDLAGTPGAILKDCQASISSTPIVGGSGSAGTTEKAEATGAEGLHVDGGFVVLRGGARMFVQGGDGAHKVWCGWPAVPCEEPIDLAGGFAITTANGASVLVQEDVPLAGGMDGLAGQHAALPDPSAVTASAKVYPLLALATPVLAPGGATTLLLAAEPGPALLGISPLVLAPAYPPGFDGALHVQLDASRFLAVVLPASGMLALPLALPPAVSGLELVLQLAACPGGTATLSDPAVLVVL